MQNTTSRAHHHDPHHLAARAVASAGLFGVALIHLLDLPGKIKETPYLGVAYIGLIAASVVTAALLMMRDDKRTWMVSAGIAVATVVGFVLNRTVGMPSAHGDIGNWLEPLGLASLFIEGIVVLVSGLVLGELTARRGRATA